MELFVGRWHGDERGAAAITELFAFQERIKTMRDRKLKTDQLLDEGKVSPRAFWTGMSELPLLREIALAVFSSVCSSAASERNFSSHKFVRSSVRTRVASLEVEKLVHLCFNRKNEDDDNLRFLAYLSQESDGESSEECQRRQRFDLIVLNECAIAGQHLDLQLCADR